MDITQRRDKSALINEIEARIKECNKTLNMTYMKANNPWKPDNFPNHYLPSPELGLLPPVFVLGVVLDRDDWLQFAVRKGIVKNGQPKSLITTMHLIRVYLKEACGHSVKLYTCLPTEDGTFALAFVSNYTLREGENLHGPLTKMKEIFADFGREPKWYLDFGINGPEKIEREDWTMDVEIV